MDIPTFHRADTERVILIVHEGVEPTGNAQAELLRLFMDAAEHRHVERVSACSPAGREILRLVERERELAEEVDALRDDLATERTHREEDEERERKLREVLAPVLAVFKERAGAWDRMRVAFDNTGWSGPPPVMDPQITLTAEFNVEALRALLKEE